MASGSSILNLQSLQVTAPLTRNEGLAAIVKRLVRVARLYALAAAIGAAAILLLVAAFLPTRAGVQPAT